MTVLPEPTYISNEHIVDLETSSYPESKGESVLPYINLTFNCVYLLLFIAIYNTLAQIRTRTNLLWIRDRQEF